MQDQHIYSAMRLQVSPERVGLTPSSPADPSAQYFEGKRKTLRNTFFYEGLLGDTNAPATH